MECQASKNKEHCNCKHTSCSRYGVCCECIRYHLSSGELPACCFPDSIADMDERSISKFLEVNS